MKKRAIGLTAAAVCLCLLSGCGGNSEPPAQSQSAGPAPSQSAAASTESAGVAETRMEQVQAILDSSAFTDELDELDCDTAWALYRLEDGGLSREQLTDGMIWRSAGATCEELALLIFSDEEAAQAALEPLETYLQNQINSNRDYRPAEIPKLEDALLQQTDNTVLMVVSNDTPAVEEQLG